ncbi:MAG TPA: DNA-processing protein DprA [Acidimicrobiales bacterium]|nr:DNA-processing protein DprA [Acidimicrobiales bacterium]
MIDGCAGGQGPEPLRCDDARYAAALACLGAGPKRLREFLDDLGPEEAWGALGAGRHRADPRGEYRAKVRDALVDQVTRACEMSRVSVLVRGSSGYPRDLVEDHEAPAVLFARGDASCCNGRSRVSIVGTRSATPYGLGVASELGAGLAEAGVVVVSGLAAGIDTAAHSGALGARGAPALGVLGTAHDTSRPRSQAFLARDLASHGAVVSEIPPGTAGSPAWWFVVRNRVMAALAHVVVVVECHAKGGALHTVKAAACRGVAVAAVPGSVRSAASAGTNALLVDGAAPVRDTGDVLSLLELEIAALPGISRPQPRQGSGARPRKGGRRQAPNPVAAKVLRALDHDPASLDTVVRRCGLSLGETALALEQLADAEQAVIERGWWSRPRS